MKAKLSVKHKNKEIIKGIKVSTPIPEMYRPVNMTILTGNVEDLMNASLPGCPMILFKDSNDYVYTLTEIEE